MSSLRNLSRVVRTRLAGIPVLFLGVMLSAILLAIFAELASVDSAVIALPVQWLWVSLLPLFVSLVVGGYVGKFKGGGLEFEPGMKILPYAAPGDTEPSEATGEQAAGTLVTRAWQEERDAEYARTDALFVVHVFTPSARRGQMFDITVFLMRHVKGSAANQTTGFAEIEKAEFYFGSSWGHRVFTANNEGGFIGVRTSAWGTFLATCRVTFKEQKKAPLILHRYIDFEMKSPKT